MKLYILRHGQSPSATEAGVATDFERPLSPVGRDDVRKNIGLMLKKGGRPGLILHSPLRRARETAEEAASLIKPRPVTESFDGLSNQLPGPELFSCLKPRLNGTGEVLLVGHQPQIGELAAILTGTLFEIRPAGLVALELKGDPPAEALWASNPGDAPK